MANRLAHLSDIDPHDHIFNSLFLNPDTTNSCQHYSLQYFNNLKIDSLRNFLNVRSFNSNGTSYQALFSNLTRIASFIVFTETWNSLETYGMCKVYARRWCVVFSWWWVNRGKVGCFICIYKTTIETCVYWHRAYTSLLSVFIVLIRIQYLLNFSPIINSE